MNRFLLFLASAIAVFSVKAVDYDFSYATDKGEISLLGYESVDHYDVGIFIPADGLTDAHAKLTKITALAVKHEQVQNFTMWASSQFNDPGVGMKFSGDIFNAPAVVEDTDYGTLVRISAELTNPYTLTSNGVYVGYSFDVKAIDRTSNFTKYPIVVTEEPNGENAMMARAAKNHHVVLAMDDISLYCTATFSGDFLIDAARVAIETVYAKKGEPTTCTAQIHNQGITPIEEVEYAYELDGVTGSGSAKVDLSGRPGSSTAISFDLPPFETTGQKRGTLTLTKVNGFDNTFLDASYLFKVTVLEHMPTHRPVMEEFSGTWCGWCPRGMAGIQKCKDEIEDFIAIAYHQRDVMELYADVPENPAGYPYCTIDRMIGGDPYFGTSTTEPGHIVTDFMEIKSIIPPADIEVKAEWNDDASALLINSTTTFAYIPEDGFNYRVSYVVIEDGLQGETADWLQANYLSGSQGRGDKYLNQYYEAPSHIYGLEYNDVAVYTTAVRGVARSLPKTNELETGVAYEHSYTAPLSDFLTKRREPSYQDQGKMKIVALLIKQESTNGTIVNANIADIAAPAGIHDADNSDAQVVKVEYYDITGKRINAPEGTFSIRKEILDNGEVRISKISR